ncbi:enoyl-CoA hydratase/carnithine racemase [Deinobacterium chartae]|uniref:Enoyl-CoA hydratase/carnithine racemase n=1 Tax=Deinobacterium chartae TaxID=521158 RepID=A0A841I1C4_9DEIO|nr:enoyl-CoA hydratase/isomerase family protein [Deinobacterium chartae]MBB6098199.1 enoyl-CoA hydratase/carnithine racemase [Deinobacterium chartae]
MSERAYVGRDPESFGFQYIRYEKRDYVATVTFNRPEVLNCVNLPMLQELQVAFKDVMWDDSVAVLVLTGEGKAFCTGADMREQAEFQVRPRDYYKWMQEFIAAHELLRNLGKPSIARLGGIVVGGGNEFNMSCDLAIMADHAYIRQVGASHGSVAAAGATQYLPLIVGDRRAREILFLNEEIPAEKALEWGLVNQVVPLYELDAAVARMAEKLYNKLPTVLRYTKQQLNYWRDMSWGTTIGHAKDWLAIHNVSLEVQEGVRAFAEKRRPDYRRLREAWREDTRPEFPEPGE